LSQLHVEPTFRTANSLAYGCWLYPEPLIAQHLVQKKHR
jgi:hypothetical protein